MATKNDQNVFTSPWNDSDMVLVVEDQELHVHKWILTSQSPVFKAMFDGQDKEASQDKITLKEKDLQSMVQFLKTLYPSSMFGEAKAPLNDGNRLSIMALAEEFQCVNLIKLCIGEAKITPENVLQVLPYILKYQQTALPQMYNVIKWGVPTSELEELLPKVESKETSNTMLLTKCRFLESAVVEMQDCMFSLICAFLREKEAVNDAVESLNNANKLIKDLKESRNDDKGRDKSTFSGSLFDPTQRHAPTFCRRQRSSSGTTSSDSRCPHSVGVQEIDKTKSCQICKEKYKVKFLAPIPISSRLQNTHNFFNMLQRGDDVATAVKRLSPPSSTTTTTPSGFSFRPAPLFNFATPPQTMQNYAGGFGLQMTQSTGLFKPFEIRTDRKF